MFRQSNVRIKKAAPVAQPVTPLLVQELGGEGPEMNLNTFIPLTAFRLLQALPKKQLMIPRPDSNPKSKQ